MTGKLSAFVETGRGGRTGATAPQPFSGGRTDGAGATAGHPIPVKRGGWMASRFSRRGSTAGRCTRRATGIRHLGGVAAVAAEVVARPRRWSPRQRWRVNGNKGRSSGRGPWHGNFGHTRGVCFSRPLNCTIFYI